jgi:hypothetical protein
MACPNSKLLDMEIENYGYSTDLMHLLDLNTTDKATWNMKSEGMGHFVDGLTALAALACDERGNQVRRMIVVQGERCIQNIVDALSCREVLLKCKSANALGSICMYSASGIMLMAQHGDAVTNGLLRMVCGKNRWAQGDACFVLGWIVQWIEESHTVLDCIENVITNVCEMLDSSLKLVVQCGTQPSVDESIEDRESNLRIYPLVLLLNLAQRRSLVKHAVTIVNTMHGAIIAILNECVSVTEANTIAHLSVSVLLIMAHSIPSVTQQLLKKKILPLLVKLNRRKYPDQCSDIKLAEQCYALMEIVIKSR